MIGNSAPAEWVILPICSITKAYCKRRCERRDAPTAQIEARQSRGFWAKGKLRDKSNVIAASLTLAWNPGLVPRDDVFIIASAKSLQIRWWLGCMVYYKERSMGIHRNVRSPFRHKAEKGPDTTIIRHCEGILTYAPVSGAETRLQEKSKPTAPQNSGSSTSGRAPSRPAKNRFPPAREWQKRNGDDIWVRRITLMR